MALCQVILKSAFFLLSILGSKKEDTGRQDRDLKDKS